MPVPVARDFVASPNDPPYDIGILLADPAQHEKSGLDLMFVENVQDQLDIPVYAT
jgi:hypothetical protein